MKMKNSNYILKWGAIKAQSGACHRSLGGRRKGAPERWDRPVRIVFSPSLLNTYRNKLVGFINEIL
jgi:hypothetical protein